MKNFISSGSVMTFTAPTGGVVSGGAYLIGGLLLIAVADAAEDADAEGHACGVFELPIKTGDTPTQFQLAYWDDSESEFTVTATDNTVRGVFVTSEDANGKAQVYLSGAVA